MIDCAVLIAAQELGLFERHGVRVELTREVGWATIREKLLHKELNAAHAPCSMAFAIRCGIGVVPQPCLTAFVLSLNGSAITLSTEMRDLGVCDAQSLKRVIDRQRGQRIFHLGAVLELSTQNYHLRHWLRSGGIDPDRDVRIPIIPSPMIHRRLLEGHLDGYCAGEPWNSIAVLQGGGFVVAHSAEIDPGMPEKILLVLEEFAETHPEEHLAIVAALMEASVFCQAPENRPELIEMLADPRYLDVPVRLLANSLIGPFDSGDGRGVPSDLITYSGNEANVPNRQKGRRIFDEISALGVASECRAFRPDVIGKIFREDLYAEACERSCERSGLPERRSAEVL
jgi:ABC-type nitrate/sulfonate/bicarbonate transport system substrate-binding protein